MPRLVLPQDPRRFVPTAARPVRAKARHLDPDTEIQPHSHAWAQVAMAVSGVARITARHLPSAAPGARRPERAGAALRAHSTYLVPSGRAVWIPPHVEHVVTVVEAAELRTLYIHQPAGLAGPGVATALGGAAPEAADVSPWRSCRVLEVSALLREVVMQMDIEMDGVHKPTPELLARERRLGELALDELRRAAPVKLGIELPQDKRLRALCEAVLDAPSRHATLQGWALEAGASERTVARLFRQELGTTFAAWRQQVLLAKALALAARKRPMAHIAAELGYASPSAFTAMVTRSVGMPPSRFFHSG
jgi:AraC-like DNA-binding protein